MAQPTSAWGLKPCRTLANHRSIQWDPGRLSEIASELSITLLAVGREHEHEHEHEYDAAARS